MNNELQSYFIRLGFNVDQPSFARYQATLREAADVIASRTGGIAGDLLKLQGGVTASFVAMGAAALGLADKVSQADLGFQIYAQHMYLSANQARSLKMATDALGHSLEDIAWNPELRARAGVLFGDEATMAEELGPNFEEQMARIRDIRFEFTRMQVELQYLSMHVVEDFMSSLGIGPADLLRKLQQVNEWIITHIPELSREFVHWFQPVFRDTRDVLGDTVNLAKQLGVSFANVIGLLSGDHSIEGTSFNFEKVAGAIQHVVHWMALFTESIVGAEEVLLHLFDAATLGMSGRFGDAAAEIRAALANVSAGSGAILGTAAGPVAGALLGMPAGPLGMLAGAGLGALGGAGAGALVHRIAGQHLAPKEIFDLVQQAALSYGINPALAHAIARQESGEREFDATGNVITSRAGALGVMQLMPDVAARLGVDPRDSAQNVQGGMALLRQLMSQYRGDLPEVLAAYNMGSGNFDRYLAGKVGMPSETRDYVRSVMAHMGTVDYATKAVLPLEARNQLISASQMGSTGVSQIGPITVNVARTDASPHEIATAVAAKVEAVQSKRVQRNLTEFGSYGYSY